MRWRSREPDAARVVFNAARAFRDLRAEVRLGPRPAGSPANRRDAHFIARRLRRAGVRDVRIQRPWRNVVGRIPGSQPGAVVVGAHRDTKDIPGFVGANDGASGVAVLLELARDLPNPAPGPSLDLAFFDAEESRGASNGARAFERTGDRGSRQYVRYAAAGGRQGSPLSRSIRAMVLFDMVGDCDLRIPRERLVDPRPLRALLKARRPERPSGGTPRAILDDHTPFERAGIPAVDLIDFDYGPGPGARAPGGTTAQDKLAPRLRHQPRRCRRARSLAAIPKIRSAPRRAAPRLPFGRMPATATSAPRRVLLASPRGYCAGVDRAVQTVEQALDLHGPPVYVRKEIVHNKHVVQELAARGAIFVEEETEVPEGELVVFSAHGVAPSVHENAAARGLRTIDATCPLVTKVHVEARKFAEQGYTIVLIGHEGHEEVEGTTGEAPQSIVLVQTVDDADELEVDDPERVAYITQTTLSVDETTAIIERLKERFPAIVGPKSDDICYATTNRQIAVKQLARECDLVLVIGSTNSSNSNRLVEVAREHGAASHLIDNAGQVDESWLEGVETVGITSGASAPEELVERLVEFFVERGAAEVAELRTVDEDVRFMLPKKIRAQLAAR